MDEGGARWRSLRSSWSDGPPVQGVTHTRWLLRSRVRLASGDLNPPSHPAAQPLAGPNRCMSASSPYADTANHRPARSAVSETCFPVSLSTREMR